MHGHIPKPAPVKLGAPMTAEERQAAQSLKEDTTVWIRIDGGVDPWNVIVPGNSAEEVIANFERMKADSWACVDALAGRLTASE